MEYKLKPESRATRHMKPASPREIEDVISDFILELRCRFREQSEKQPAEFKKQVVRLVRRHLPPRPGRPNNPRIDAAVRMVEQGKPIREVLRAQMPDFDRLDSYGRYLAEKGLRVAVTRRCRSRGSPLSAPHTTAKRNLRSEKTGSI